MRPQDQIICIDKAHLVLRTSIQNGSWDMWNRTSCIIVDAYHYNQSSHYRLDVLKILQSCSSIRGNTLALRVSQSNLKNLSVQIIKKYI
ncbi:hypothetical protein BYT27DRAFT_7085249 [Phlegmacium glaucopus]|nr:hypothetical protein BYT27DRAFT_7085249 [Phlegmacium glaucopus]